MEGALPRWVPFEAERIRRGAETRYLGPNGTMRRTGPCVSISACEVTRHNALFGAEGSRAQGSAFRGWRDVRHRRLTPMQLPSLTTLRTSTVHLPNEYYVVRVSPISFHRVQGFKTLDLQASATLVSSSPYPEPVPPVYIQHAVRNP